jgi:SprT protein
MQPRRFTERTAVTRVFEKYLPADFVELVVEHYVTSAVRFKIVRGRKSKLGDFRAGRQGEKHQITVNGTLNPYAFLITTLHEFAHLQTFNQYGFSVQPHGAEWKNTYRKLLLPVVDHPSLPSDLKQALTQSLISTKASSCTDHQLSRVLRNYDEQKDDTALLEQLPNNTTFALNGRHFVKGPLRRKRYLCEDVHSKRVYLVNALAEVVPVN